MKTIRRLYFYLVALISVEVVLWGLINLLRSIANQTVGGASEALARALALTLVGLPIFLFHWLWAQRLSDSDDEERTASLRALFLYGILLGTLIPLIQNLFALVNRGLLTVTGLQTGRALLGSSGTAIDNLIAISINGLVAFYFWNILRTEWGSLPSKENFIDVRRLYRYVWVIYGLLMTLYGAQQILRFLFFVPSGLLGELTRETIINGVALLLIGVPLWTYAWSVVQVSLLETAERESNLRLGILYILSLSGVITVLTTAAIALQVILNKLLGTQMTTAEFINRIGGPLSVGIPLGVVWAYHGYWLYRHIEAIGEPVRQAGMKRVYYYILSAIGLGGTFIGVALLIKFMIDRFTGGYLVINEAVRSDLAQAISIILAWLPLWLVTWRAVEAEATTPGDTGDHARRSIVRKSYLYLALFAGVIGGMISAVALIFQLIKTALTRLGEAALLSTILNDLQLLMLFALLLVYHLGVMRRDGRSAAAALAKKQAGFKVLVVDSGKGFAASIKAALAKTAPNVPVTVAARQPRGKYDAMILSGSRALDAPPWLRSYKGTRIVVPNEAKGLLWAGGISSSSIQKAALAVRQLAEGQSVQQKAAGPGWMIVIYIAASLFGIELIMMLVVTLISTFAGGGN